MKTKQKNPLYIFTSFTCGVSVFLMSIQFQKMAYWGNDLMWYWLGIVVTYVLLLLGGLSLVPVFTKNKPRMMERLLSVLSIVLLILGFLWTTFVIVAGLSGL